MLPCVVVPGKETRELIKLIVDRIQHEVSECSNKQLQIELNGNIVSFTMTVKLSQLDGKLLIEISGLRGAFCLLCTVSRDDANDISEIKKGFKMDRTNEDMIALYEYHGENLLKIKSADRVGLTHEPMISGSDIDIYNMLPCLHAWINTLRKFVHLAYLLNSRHAYPNNEPFMGQGRAKNPEQSNAYDLAKAEFRNMAKNGPLNLAIDLPDSSGKGGNTNTGIRFSISASFVKLFKKDLRFLQGPIVSVHFFIS